MVFRTLVHAASALALLTSPTDGFNVYVLNRCTVDIQLAHVTMKSMTLETLGVGKTLVRAVPLGEPSHVIKAGAGPQATLGEFSAEGGSWFDISIIPTGPKSGPDYCPSLQACKEHTGGVGYNYPMQITPRRAPFGVCRTLTCMHDGCEDAYQYPKDDTKTHSCPVNTDFDLTFCPGGTGGLTPEPTPTPTPSPTPSPTPTPTPTPTSTPLPNEGSSSLDVEGRVSLPSEAEVAGDADLSVVKTEAPIVEVGGPSSGSVNEVTTRSSVESSTGAEVYILSILGGVGCVAAAAIVVVRQKKQALDELNVKTPRERATTGAALSILITPDSEITVL